MEKMIEKRIEEVENCKKKKKNIYIYIYIYIYGHGIKVEESP